MPAMAPPDMPEDDFREIGADEVAAGPALPVEELEVVEGDDDAVVEVANVVDVALAEEADADVEVVEGEDAAFRTTTLGLETCWFCSVVKLVPAGRKRKVHSVLSVNWSGDIETTHEIDCVALTLTPAVNN